MTHYIPITDADRQEMLRAIGVEKIEDLFTDVPADYRFPPLELPPPLSEPELMAELNRLSETNAHTRRYSIFLGAGAYNHFVPAAVDQILRRGEYYTAYTPYQPEISQGTLQAIFEYQSLICALTGMEIANASHYDGATALAESAIMALNVVRNRRKIVVARGVHPQYRAVLRTYLQGLDVTIVGDENPNATIADAVAQVDEQTALLIVQNPDFLGRLHDLRGLGAQVQARGALLAVHFDPIALGLFQTPAEAGADIATGEGQPLGLGLAFGGPYLGIFTTRQKYVHKIAGRIVGVTKDVDGRMAYVLTLRAREQDIRRERATSNICTNQGLMALASAVYMSLMGKRGMRKVAEITYHRAHYAARRIADLPDYRVLTDQPFFREFVVQCPRPVAEINAALREQGIIGGYDLSNDEPQLGNAMLVAVTEMNTPVEIDRFVAALAAAA
ncbi:MAG: aminomethyl-transferring glycine dehydrogenase subunit GcvPA [Chloroflexus sp.]|jgi:glycine dehydrogenase subunit 1|uniref:aminomethyl-transferring glycine dehydrogenase subunit GcvPA n=1 Tax=unclassified Chloroflexus TaxID=2633855 RepID=UPI0004DF54CD|nr:MULTISPECIES: aminomethyl-transferring glycine dehydrogenase subunit GcvPA [unclassified Chloroflexus]MBO9313042.1 aminomethyl-transferring glycine dehydrogenase subunit GcvPA [Chloroflexus sp.]MBO9315606.1 aminomethyl-transferring glycine dehydrogenase subunit GcvPA [Chloroflexus sp.]MBO9338927.1 aminomethyl-transferring glycine dehydrogenase subunit GcvPA [Chloroflexus sp.]MBO9349006.1 aminomethyl-transferring glycine dehydrogenase subunit GcvPA [Chloroflexus sp.]MDN5272306.1 aminomethyl-